jgi:hypothetical protein
VSGLSQHTRCRHPLVRNADRLAPVSRPEKSARPVRSFSLEEIELMLQLEEAFKGDPRISMKMAELMETKTAKQIRDKRKEPAYIAKRDARLANASQGCSCRNETSCRCKVTQVPSEDRASPNMATRRGCRAPIEPPANVARSLRDTSDLSLATEEAEREKHPSPSIGEPVEASQPSTASLSGAAKSMELESINNRASNYSSAIHPHDDAEAEAKWREGLIASLLAWETKEGPMQRRS